jgi:peptidoglycan/LPS O-acetylase OafA/YrhL
MAAGSTQLTAEPPRRGNRVPWLDGVRGAAATFVVLHHIWLTTWPAFPRDTGPWWLGWLLYGHMAVAVFIVVSGFSLALAPMRNGGRLSGGVKRFLSRRAWRILPAYWAALILSVLITQVLLQPEAGIAAIGRTLAVHGLLLQDVVGSQTPNGALWSIAVEWQIYFVFPLILLVGRRTGHGTAVVTTAAVVLVVHEIAGLGGVLAKLNHLTPQFLALFALGSLAVWVGGGDRAQRLRAPLAAVTLATVGGFVALALTQGSEWMVAQFFWMDLLFGVGVAALMHAGGFAPLRRVLASRIALFLGLFSYSIYLIHDPIVSVLNRYAFGPLGLSPLATFGLFIVVGLPVILALCYGFHLMFEAPFLRNRSLSAVRTMPIVRRLPQLRRPVAPPPAPQPVAAERAAG